MILTNTKPDIPSRPSSREDIEYELSAAKSGLFAYLLAAVRNYHDAEDLLQEVSLVALDAAESFTPGTNFSAWSREIARRRVLAFVRRRDGSPVAIDPIMLEVLTDAAAEIDSEEPLEERMSLLAGCLAKLRKEMRDVLEYKYWNHLSAEETAERLGRTVQAVYAILKRSRIQLRECLDGNATPISKITTDHLK